MRSDPHYLSEPENFAEHGMCVPKTNSIQFNLFIHKAKYIKNIVAKSICWALKEIKKINVFVINHKLLNILTLKEFLENTFRSWTIQKEGNLYWNPGFRVGLASTFCFCIPRIPRKCLLSIFYLRKHFAVPRSTVKNWHFFVASTLPKTAFFFPSTLSTTALSRAQHTVKKLPFAVPSTLFYNCNLPWPVHC